jgi:AMP-binding enzyme
MRRLTGTPLDRMRTRWHCGRSTSAAAPPKSATRSFAATGTPKGATGTPKGAMDAHGAVLTHYVSSRYALDLHSDDIYWCTADPGWVTGTSYGIIAPLTNGLTTIVDSGSSTPGGGIARWPNMAPPSGTPHQPHYGCLRAPDRR